MWTLLQSPLVNSAVCIVLFTFVARFIARGYAIRQKCRKLPGAPHSMIWGHLKEMGTVAGLYPRRVHPHTYPHKIRTRHNLGSLICMDVWPINDPFIAVMDPAASQQCTVEFNTEKHPAMKPYLDKLVGPDDMISANGELWQKWRRMFNPGFSSQHLTTLIPGIVDDVLVYVENLKQHADKEEVFRLEEDTTRLTVDVIGRVILDLHFDMQRSDNPCIEALREQVHLLPNQGHLNPLDMWHPYGIYRRWKNHRIMEDYIGKILDERFARSNLKETRKERKKTVIDLALSSYMSGVEADLDDSSIDASKLRMDAAFRKGAITQIRVCLFAGHDTTSSTMCYLFYLLQNHPECHRRICQEHERVLGQIENTAETIKTHPHLLNQLPYTMACIKETLRLFPAASAPRMGDKALTLRDPKTGESYPTEGLMVWLVHHGLGRNPDVWGETVSQFDPTRFLPENAHRVPEGAWRPFEMGQRNCLGQNLALLELRIISALCCRVFDFELRMDAIEELKKDGSFYARNEAFRQGPQEVEGEPLYQTLIGAAKPREGMPVAVRYQK
ncbi:cytochrome P450 [Lecanosticta acicola]|uniref:Cytochrome P450 n=1 Tax=Lecanosticta acicola TaxID=111012 RepID=A0AAI8YSW4_9PEZI|nr:cytochrome P450 [Lecanosticta acicola]